MATHDPYKQTPRESFNGGYWDGRDDRESVRARRTRDGKNLPLPDFAPVYSEGYDFGFDAKGWDATYTNEIVCIREVWTDQCPKDCEAHSSEPAWKRRQAKAKAQREERKARKAMRPGRQDYRV
ncbi:hypothetical protein LCGC14_0592320 [marine sediment metagenome]|uniref:Uncharacterized protein n=1 Tax=marine sediment metagenome TaxID=412755 RepID=A0A0F9RI30_9ZZZZ